MLTVKYGNSCTIAIAFQTPPHRCSPSIRVDAAYLLELAAWSCRPRTFLVVSGGINGGAYRVRLKSIVVAPHLQQDSIA